LVPGDTNNAEDVFLYDLRERKIERISIGYGGAPGNGPSSAGQRPSVSADGRYVAFASDASNLVHDDNNGCSDIFVFDREAQHPTPLTRVSMSLNGAEANFASIHPNLSADGRFVAFQSGASNLVAGDGKNIYNVFVYDQDTGETQLVSHFLDGSAGTEPSRHPALSADGRFVAFESQANLVPGATLIADVFVYDRHNRVLERASVDADSTPGNDHSLMPFLSADGSYVVFQSYASNFVYGETESSSDVFIRPTLGMEQRASQFVDLRVGEIVRGVDFGNRRERGAIEGVVFNDVNGDGIRAPDDPPLAGWTVFLDTNGNGIPDGRTLSSANSTDIPGWSTATSRLSIQDLDQAVTNIKVTVDIACLRASDLSAVLISPQGTRVSLFAHVDSSLPNFSGTTFDDEATEPVNAGRDRSEAVIDPRFRSALWTERPPAAHGLWKSTIVVEPRPCFIAGRSAYPPAACRLNPKRSRMTRGATVSRN
jgi:Tol biopolymer transport system component